jgi:hypothetical protein
MSISSHVIFNNAQLITNTIQNHATLLTSYKRATKLVLLYIFKVHEGGLTCGTASHSKVHVSYSKRTYLDFLMRFGTK